MRLIRGDWTKSYLKQRKEIKDLGKDIVSLQERLTLQTSTDAYKDDIISTLQILLESKDELIGSLRDQTKELRD